MTETRSSHEPDRRDFGKFLSLVLELGALLLVAYYFQLENQGFFRLFALAAGGFVVHYLIPFRVRLPFFLLLSLAGIAMVLGWQGVWLVGIGITLVGICHLPIAFARRVGLLVLAAALLVPLRAGWLPSPWSAAIWPVLGSMFMFRLIVYVYDTKHEKVPASWWQRLSYFFLLPNVCFPLFPVVDYKTFRRTYYDGERHEIYQVGVVWILRGLTQLVLYRLVYYYGSMSPTEVADLGDLGRYVVSGFLLYLRISGQFHVIVGLLRLFGFNLPETHHLYFLASSFTEFWRRINIYWKDFMMKTFFYPAFFKLRKRGELTALLASTALVFFATWVLHAYQWFWIRGSYLLTWTDTLFWALLAVLVMINTLYEARHGRQRLTTGSGWTVTQSVGLVARTAGTFAAITILWSLWTSASLDEWITLWTTAFNNPTVDDARLVPAALLGLVLFAAATLFFASRERERIQRRMSFGPSVAGVVSSAALVCVIGTPDLYARYVPGSIRGTYVDVVASAREVRLSGHDADMLERGYYEDLLSVQTFNSQLWEVYARWPVTWSRFEDTGALRLTGDFLKQELVPSQAVHFRNATLRTNRWGMRDQEYEQRRPAGVVRLALVGSSHVMGYGVDDDETFDARLEERLNADKTAQSRRTFEVLNFAVDGYTPLQELAQVDTKVLAFQPDVVLYVAHYGAAHRASLHLAEMARGGVSIPYPELREIVQSAGIEPGTTRFQSEQRLAGSRDQILEWAYRHMVTTVRERGAVPVWVYLPQVGDTVPADALARFEEMARQAGFITLSLADVFDGHPIEAIRFGPGDHHPNVYGHQLIADRLYDRLQSAWDVLLNGDVGPDR